MILNIESKYDKIADELGSYMFCLVFLIARIIVWFLSKILE